MKCSPFGNSGTLKIVFFFVLNHFQQTMMKRKRFLARYFSFLVLTKAKHAPSELIGLCCDKTSFRDGIFMEFSLQRCMFIASSILGRVCLFLGG